MDRVVQVPKPVYAVVGLSSLSGTHSVATTGQAITDIYRAVTLAKTYIEDSRYADPNVLLIHPRLWNDWVGTLFDTVQRPSSLLPLTLTTRPV